jgi:N4-gp56 family major capsid protein
MQTQVPAGSPLARKIFGAALFAKVVAASNFVKALTGDAPQQSDAEAKLKGQTVPGMPVVRVTDLSKSAGDTVSVDAFDTISGKPIMGDANAEGRGSSLSSSSMDISINNTTKTVDAGGKMAQQRTVHQLRGIAMSQLTGYFPRLHAQSAMVHLAGARGTQTGKDWVVPLSADADFSSILINAIKAPTYNRHYVVNGTALTNGGAQLASIASTDLMTLAHVDVMSVILSDHNMGLQPVMISDDPAADDDPIKGVWYMTERQWNDIKVSNSYQTAMQNAWARKSYGTKHPLFSGEPIMWNGILIRKLPKFAIRHLPGENTNIITAANRYTATESVQAVNAGLTAGYAMERSLLLGAQALAYVFGKNQGSDTGFNWLENLYNFERNLEVGGESMGGMAKLRFKFDDGAGNLEPTDNGVFVIDSAVKL